MHRVYLEIVRSPTYVVLIKGGYYTNFANRRSFYRQDKSVSNLPGKLIVAVDLVVLIN